MVRGRERCGALSFAALIALIILALVVVDRAVAGAVWEEEWARTVDEAKREGQVNVYISRWEAVIEAGVFQKRFPQIKVLAVTGRSADITQRLLAERRAGKHLADLTSQGFNTNHNILHATGAFDPIKRALILPDVVDESKWFHRRHRYADVEGQYVFIYAGSPQVGTVSFNTRLVNPNEIKSFWDLVNSKLRGKIAARDIRRPGIGNGAMRLFYYHPKLGPKFIRTLFGDMDVTLFTDFRQGTDWLASGKFPICFFCAEIDKAKRQGLPVDTLGTMREGAGLVSENGTLALVKNAPHPNAAKVFANWLVSREGQSTLQAALARADIFADSLRTDIPKDVIPPSERRVDGVEYLELDVPGRIDMKPILEVFDEVVAKTKKK